MLPEDYMQNFMCDNNMQSNNFSLDIPLSFQFRHSHSLVAPAICYLFFLHVVLYVFLANKG